jgi:hypothetical protein
MRVVCLMLLLAGACMSQASEAPAMENLSITIDLESASAVVALLEQKQAPDSQLDLVANLYGNQQLIRKAVEAGATNVTAEDFKRTLKQVIETGKTTGDDVFDWATVKSNLRDVRALIRGIEANKQALVADINQMISAYSPASLKVDVRAYCVLSVTSLDLSHELSADLFRHPARSAKEHN